MTTATDSSISEIPGKFEVRYGKITRINPDNGKPHPYKDKDSGEPNPTLYVDIRVEEPRRRSEFLKGRVRLDGLQVFTGKLYHGLLGHHVNVTRPVKGDYVVVEGVVKRDVPVLINGEQRLENRIYLVSTNAITVDTNRPGYKAPQNSI